MSHSDFREHYPLPSGSYLSSDVYLQRRFPHADFAITTMRNGRYESAAFDVNAGATPTSGHPTGRPALAGRTSL